MSIRLISLAEAREIWPEPPPLARPRLDLHWIRKQLYHWGLRNRAQGIGYPTMSAETKAIYGRGGRFEGPNLPPDLEEIDVAVRKLKPGHKEIIAECYTHGGTHQDHMIRLRLPERTYFHRKKTAETKVYWLVQSLPNVAVNS
jgi:hypothetical protein